MRAGPAITQKETIRTRAANHRETDDTRLQNRTQNQTETPDHDTAGRRDDKWPLHRRALHADGAEARDPEGRGNNTEYVSFMRRRVSLHETSTADHLAVSLPIMHFYIERQSLTPNRTLHLLVVTIATWSFTHFNLELDSKAKHLNFE
ncbi:hypothetical protein EYF80_045763 [Liparis tanakae]|uniref:Uncharacterized protein n=1 Tax=Liparis tanakae TaxID=230148 RepID=A0A4Z2FSA2_9TELE|nr:hypothetical protein EYF80_045763 [Liparis tanakae]